MASLSLLGNELIRVERWHFRNHGKSLLITMEIKLLGSQGPGVRYSGTLLAGTGQLAPCQSPALRLFALRLTR